MAGTLDPGTSTPSKGVVYERRRPETGTLYRVVRDNLQTLYAAVEDGFAAPLPAFVRDEFERYLACGILCRGFAWAARIAIDSVLGFYKRRMRDVDGVLGQSGAVSVVQRTSSDLRLNPHLHAILLDGVFVDNCCRTGAIGFLRDANGVGTAQTLTCANDTVTCTYAGKGGPGSCHDDVGASCSF